jgi:hypothetical protein
LQVREFPVWSHAVPQRLKPHSLRTAYGTTEVVP